MERKKLYEKLNRVFREVFDDDTITVMEGTTADDIEEWDSLEHINLIIEVEKEFGIKFSMSEVNTMRNVGEMVEIIEGKGI